FLFFAFYEYFFSLVRNPGLSIMDNGLGINSSKEGWGTKQFKNLAQQIKGKFRRVSLYPQGTLCELSWPLANSFWWQ
ncbi:hypothetical protein FJR01_17780, partial [Dolichospermum sp. UHCC 0299]|nr:hypothetical protein [Dolichospermum sp. DET73]MTJ18702.1 hypothetical protein [Dolichospermum sp. UHCC 0299]